MLTVQSLRFFPLFGVFHPRRLRKTCQKRGCRPKDDHTDHIEAEDVSQELHDHTDPFEEQQTPVRLTLVNVEWLLASGLHPAVDYGGSCQADSVPFMVWPSREFDLGHGHPPCSEAGPLHHRATSTRELRKTSQLQYSFRYKQLLLLRLQWKESLESAKSLHCEGSNNRILKR